MSWVEKAYQDYTIHKQTYVELELKYSKSEKTIRKYFDKFKTKKSLAIVDLKPINLIFDTTFFKKRFGIMVFRKLGKNLSWKYVETEKLSFYLEELLRLKEFGYNLESFTIDGRKGLIQLLHKHFPNIPIQLCCFHQVQIVTRYTTRNPKTECGKELKSLILKLKSTTKSEFTNSFQKLQDKYKDFLKERNEQNQFVHRRLRSAFRSIKTNLEYLFTFQDYQENNPYNNPYNNPILNIPNTTNSCDGSFGQWKYKVKLHRGISTERMKQMIDELLSH